VARSIEGLLEALREARSRNPQLASTIAFYVALLEAQARTALPDLPPPPSPEAARRALAEGRPLIELTPLPLDAPALRALADEVCTITARHRPELAEALEAIRARLSDGGLLDEGTFADEVGAFVRTQAWRPLLRAWAARMAEQVEIADWRQPICPFCGSPPDLGALGAEDGRRYLLCSRCDTEWAFARVACPFCGDTRHQAYFPGEDERYRLYVCDACKRYLKVVDLRRGWRPVMLPVERVLTIPMDLAARQAGYR